MRWGRVEWVMIALHGLHYNDCTAVQPRDCCGMSETCDSHTHNHAQLPTLPHHHHCNPVSPTAVLLADQHSDIFNFSQLKPDFSKWLPLLKDLGPFGDTNGEYGP